MTQRVAKRIHPKKCYFSLQWKVQKVFSVAAMFFFFILLVFMMLGNSISISIAVRTRLKLESFDAPFSLVTNTWDEIIIRCSPEMYGKSKFKGGFRCILFYSGVCTLKFCMVTRVNFPKENCSLLARLCCTIDCLANASYVAAEKESFE